MFSGSKIGMKYTIYVLAEPVGNDTTWKDVRYIGMSTNVMSRYAQHLICRKADANEDKSEWIQSLLRQGKLPLLHEIETVDTIEQGRAREQHWIRYAMAQGARLLNQAITYTEEERFQAKVDRAIRYAKIGTILEQGIFVKRSDAWYPSGLRKTLDQDVEGIHIYEVFEIFFKNEQGVPCNLVESTDEEFDAFIKRYIPVMDNGNWKWDWEDRVCAVNFARSFGKTPEFCEPPPKPEKKPRRKRGGK